MPTSAVARRVRVEPLLSGELVPVFIPTYGLLCSVLFHFLLVEVIIGLHLMFFDTLTLKVRTPADIIRAGEFHDLLTLPDFSDLGGGNSGGQEARKDGRGREGSGKPSAPAPSRPHLARTGERPLPKAVYAGSQSVISDPPDATNTVQTIRRPDLIAPPKLKYPVRVQSALLLPPPPVARPVLTAPPVPEPPPAAPLEQTVNVERTVEQPVLVVRRAERSMATPTPEPPKLVAKLSKTAPALAVPARPLPVQARPDAEGLSTRAALVLNAVTLPPDTPKAIPDGEIAGSFAVVPPSAKSGDAKSPDSSAPATPGAGANGDPNGAPGGTAVSTARAGSGGNGAGNGDAMGKGRNGSGNGDGNGHTGGFGGGAGIDRGNGSGTGNGKGRGAGVGGGTGTGIGTGNGKGNGNGNGSGSGNGNGPGSGPARNPFPGISIVGAGSSPNLGPPATATPQIRGTYALTITAAGTSGGAIKDLGVFARTETVYTIYINMADEGGGNWPMQYSLLGGGSASNALLTPPYATRKVRVSAPDAAFLGKQVYVRAIITEQGNIESLMAVHNSSDPLAKAAIQALSQWEFMPAQLNGKSVPAKVLIAVVVSQ